MSSDDFKSFNQVKNTKITMDEAIKIENIVLPSIQDLKQSIIKGKPHQKDNVMYKLLFDYYEEIQAQEETPLRQQIMNKEIYQRKDAEPKEKYISRL